MILFIQIEKKNNNNFHSNWRKIQEKNCVPVNIDAEVVIDRIQQILGILRAVQVPTRQERQICVEVDNCFKQISSALALAAAADTKNDQETQTVSTCGEKGYEASSVNKSGKQPRVTRRTKRTSAAPKPEEENQ